MGGAFLAGSSLNWRSSGRNTISDTRHVHIENPGHQGSEEDLSSMPPGMLRINAEKQQMIGVRVAPVEKKAITHTIRLLGRVAADETRIYRLNAVVDGWITKALPNTTGSFVKKNEVLAAFYSPEFLSAEQALIYALSAMDRVQVTGKENPAQKDQITQFKINLRQYKDTLRNLGMGDLQVEQLIRTRTYMENIDLTSPADGFILVRNVSPGQRFEKGTEWYRIADLKTVWVLADVFEREAKHFKPGAKAKITLPYQKETFQGTISQVLPVFDGATRTLKVRIETENPGFLLRPDMFVDVELPIQLPEAISIPADAILDSGLKKTVFIDQGNGYFEPQEVEAGLRMGNRVEIIRGLEAGEKIVTSGTFLIDSESKLQLAAAGMQAVLAKDPVCGLEVSPRKAEKEGKKAYHQGKSYYFCSEEHKKQFENDPEQYLKK